MKKSFLPKNILSTIHWIISRVPVVRKEGHSHSVILTYHSITQSNWNYSVPPKVFEDQIRYLKSNFKMITLQELIQKKFSGNAASITFDDGYLDTFTTAMPILRKNNLVGTVFVLGASLPNRFELDSKTSLMHVKHLRQLHELGWEIGFHTRTHPNMLHIPESELRKEIIDGKKALENQLGFSLKYFAYPKGKYNDKIIQIVKEAGFQIAFTVEGGRLNTSNPFTITRTQIEKDQDMQALSALVSPLGLLLTDFFMFFFKLKEKYTHE